MSKKKISSKSNKNLETKQNKIIEEKKSRKKVLKFNQRMLVKYIVAGLSVEDASSKINISISRCKNWLKDENVVKYLEEQLQNKIDLDAKKRKKRMEFISSELYESLLEKIANGSFAKMGSKNLMKFILEFNKEIRTDTPGEATQKIDHHHKIEINDELMQRYKNANSRLFFNKTDSDKIIDITLPTSEPARNQDDKAKTEK